MIDSPGVHSQATGASIIQVGISEKALLLVVLAVMLVSLGVSIFALHIAGSAQSRMEARVDELEATVRSLTGEVRVAQYDLNQLCAKLIANDLVEHSCH